MGSNITRQEGPCRSQTQKELVTGGENLKTDRQKDISRQMPHLNKNTETRRLVHSFKKKNENSTKPIRTLPWTMHCEYSTEKKQHYSALRRSTTLHWEEALLCIEKKHYSVWPHGRDSLRMSYKTGMQDLNTEYMKGQGTVWKGRLKSITEYPAGHTWLTLEKFWTNSQRPFLTILKPLQLSEQ